MNLWFLLPNVFLIFFGAPWAFPTPDTPPIRLALTILAVNFLNTEPSSHWNLAQLNDVNSGSSNLLINCHVANGTSAVCVLPGSMLFDRVRVSNSHVTLELVLITPLDVTIVVIAKAQFFPRPRN